MELQEAYSEKQTQVTQVLQLKFDLRAGCVNIEELLVYAPGPTSVAEATDISYRLQGCKSTRVCNRAGIETLTDVIVPNK